MPESHFHYVLFFSQLADHFETSAPNNFETSAPNDPQMTLNTKRSKVTRMHVIPTPESQISFRFALQLAGFKLEVILKQEHRMTLK